MRWPMFATCLLASIIAAPAAAITDYVGNMEQFQFAAKVANASKSCQRLGYNVNEADAFAFVTGTVTSAIEDGMDVTLANQLATQAIKDETERQQFLLRQVKEAQGKSAVIAEAAAERFLSTWQANCDAIAADPRASRFFEKPKKH